MPAMKSKSTQQTFTKLMSPGARLVGLGQMLSPQPRTRAAGNKEKARQQEMDVDVEVPALGCRQLVPDGSHQASDGDGPYASLEGAYLGDAIDDDGVDSLNEEEFDQELRDEEEIQQNACEDGLAYAFKTHMKKAKAERKDEHQNKGSPIEGNVYRYLAMNGGLGAILRPLICSTEGLQKIIQGKTSGRLAKACGMVIILLIQIFAPFAVFLSQVAEIDLAQTGYWWSSQSRWCPEVGCLSLGLARMLGFLFVLSYLFWAINKLASERADWLKISALLTVYENGEEERKFEDSADNRSCSFPSWTRFWLQLGPWINCYMFLGGGLTICLLLKLSVSPTDVVFNSLSLLFIMKLDDPDSDLAVLQVDDWDPAEFGKWLYSEFGDGYSSNTEDARSLGNYYFQDEDTQRLLELEVAGDAGDEDSDLLNRDPRHEHYDKTGTDLIEDPNALIAKGIIRDHPAYMATRICLWGLLVLVPFFWFLVTLNPKDGTAEEVQMEMKKLLNLNLTFYAQDAQGQMSKVFLPATWALGP